jgi:hypothetical protein
VNRASLDVLGVQGVGRHDLAGEDAQRPLGELHLPCDPSQDRGELLLLLALAQWEMTPAAMAYSQMAEDAARRGVSLIPEQ